MNLLSDFRIGFDARLSMGQHSGMGRFTRALVAQREDSLVAFCATGEEDCSLRTVAYGPRFYPVWEQYAIPKLARKFNLEFFLAPYNTGPLNLPGRTKLLLVIYDLIYLEPLTSLPLSKSVYQNVGRYYRRYVVPRAAQKAYRIVTTSEYSRQEITSRLGIEPARISVIPVALKADWYEDRPLEYYGERFILAVGGEAPSKNIRRGIQAFAKYKQLSSDRSMMLRIAGVKAQ